MHVSQWNLLFNMLVSFFLGNTACFFGSLLHLGSYTCSDDNGMLRHAAGTFEEVLVPQCYFGSITFSLNSCNWPLCSCHFNSGSADLALVSALLTDLKSTETLLNISTRWKLQPSRPPGLHAPLTTADNQKSLKHAFLLIFLHLSVQMVRTGLHYPRHLSAVTGSTWIIHSFFMLRIPKW